MGGCLSRSVTSGHEAQLVKLADAHFLGHRERISDSYQQFIKPNPSTGAISVNLIACEKVTNGQIPLDTYLKLHVVKDDHKNKAIMRFANAIYPLFSTNCDVYVQGKALFELFSADDGNFSLKKMIESVASVAIHGSSFVKASSRFVDFFISDTICRDYYANLPFFLDDDEKEEKEDGDGAITEAGPNSIATPAALRPRLRSNRPQKDGPADIQMTDAETFAEWYSNAHAFQRLVTGLFQKTFLYGPDHLFFNTEDNRRKLFTQPTMSQPARLLQAEEMWFLQYNLSQGTAMSNDAWARVYTARTDGNSWNNFSSKLRASRGSTVILIRDTDGHTFGAYTEDTWKLQPDFYGKDSCALFSLRPTMAWYRPTGTNQNYQYLHQGTQTLANGLGFGGQMNYFGLFISEDFVRGHCRASPISTTFGNPQLSLKSDFEIEDLEVISVYFPRKVGRTFSSVGEDRRMSIVQDEAPVKKRASTIEEDTAFMELAGKTLYAKEVREQDEKDSPEITRSAIMAE